MIGSMNGNGKSICVMHSGRISVYLVSVLLRWHQMVYSWCETMPGKQDKSTKHQFSATGKPGYLAQNDFSTLVAALSVFLRISLSPSLLFSFFNYLVQKYSRSCKSKLHASTCEISDESGTQREVSKSSKVSPANSFATVGHWRVKHYSILRWTKVRSGPGKNS